MLVVTGAPGAGKSAVLGRIVTTADAGAARQLPPSDTAVRATSRSVGCAVHVKGKTALEVVAEIARAASGKLPGQAWDLDSGDFVSRLRETLAGKQPGYRFSVIVDAVDEAASPADARDILGKVLLRMAETCADVAARVVAGSRRKHADGNLLGMFGGAERLVDLDDAEFFAEQDLAAYALATLQLTGRQGSGSPYADD